MFLITGGKQTAGSGVVQIFASDIEMLCWESLHGSGL